jgi:peptide/nickel transport system substrate-binding protein
MRTPYPALLALAVLASPAPRETHADGKGKPAHAREVRAGDDMPTSAWRKAPPGAKPERGDTAILTLLQDIEGLNPYTSSTADSHYVQEMLWPRLMEEQADYYAGPPSFTPYVAESWSPAADGLSIRFTLRDCTWSDGTPITGDDLRFSWEAARHPGVGWNSASIVDFIRDVEVHGPRDVTVHYTERYPYQLMDVNDVHILPKHVFGKIPFEQWQKHGSWEEQAKVSGSHWLLEKVVPNQEISFTRNPRYWEPGKPYLDRVVWKVQGNMETNLNALLAGDVDFMQSVLPKDADRVLADEDLLLYSYVTRNIGWIGWNTGKPPFDDVRVRRAMTHAIDRENIVESIFYGYAEVAAPVIIRSMWASCPEIEPLEFDPDAAEKLLDEAGWTRSGDGVRAKDGKPLSFILVTNAGNDVRKKISEYVQASLKDVGVAVEIKLLDFNQMTQQLKKHSFDAYVAGMSVATKVDGRPIFHSKAAEGQFNYVDFKNPRVDEIIDQARLMSDKEAAKPLWAEMQRIFHVEQPYTTLYEPRGLVSLHKRFRNVNVTALRPTHNLHEWWVPASEQKYK